MEAERTLLERAGIASGLLTEEQISRALQVLRDAQQVPANGAAVAEEKLAAQLIALGYLNAWQAEQLRQGRTKFNLGAYRILDALGHGGMGWVFKCEHSLLGRVEAIKVLPKAKSNPTSVTSFLREIRTQAQLNHPNLVHLTYADQEGDTYFLVTEYVPGTDLRKMVRHHGPLSMKQAALIVSQAAQGLAHAHSRGLVHRDVKPGNLLITPEGLTKLADLGLAFFYDEQVSGEKKPRHIVGTADYIAPEVIVSPESLRTVSDIYSLGCTLYYAVTGKVPFPGGDTSDKLRRQLDEVPITPVRLNPTVSVEFADVIASLMEKRPADRVATAEEVVYLLKPWTNDTDESTQETLGTLTQFSRESPLNSMMAETIPGDFVPGDTSSRSSDATPSSSVNSMTLSAIVAADQARRAEEINRPFDQPRPKWSLDKVVWILSFVTLGALSAALYFAFFD